MIHESIKLFGERGADNSNIILKTYVKENLNGKRLPAMIVLPGGAFVFMGSRENEAVAMAFAAAGFQAFVLEYSTLTTAGDSSSIENMLAQVAEAMALIQERSEEWSVDPERISLCGFSAGGGLAAAYSASWKTLGGARPHAVVLGYPLLDLDEDLLWLQKNGADGDTLLLMNSAHLALFGYENPSEERYRLASPMRNVSGDIPPTFIWNTFGDNLVDPAQPLRYAALLREAGTETELHSFANGGHALALATEATAACPEDVDPAVSKWFDLALTWLAGLEKR